MNPLSRRQLVRAGLAATAGASGLAVAARIADRYGLIPPNHSGVYGAGETLTYAAHRLLTYNSQAREFSRNQISARPVVSGRLPQEEEYKRLQAAGFRDWMLRVDGMVDRPATFSLADLKSGPRRSQITQLICEEGWSYIAEWIGVPLSHLLNSVGTQATAKYVVCRSIQPEIWDSIDMSDALHPQTLITYSMNGGELPPGHGCPLRLRVPRQLGYKSLKYLTRITLTDSLNGLSPDWTYSWYAGI